MTKYFIVVLLIIQSSCYLENRNSQASFLPIDPEELKFRKGDCIAFKVDSTNYGAAIVVDYAKDEGGLWYGFLFTNYLNDSLPSVSNLLNQKVFGRRIKSSYYKEGFYIGIDTEFINGSCLVENTDKFVLFGHITIDSTKILLGAQGACGNYNKMLQSFRFGLEKRLKPPEDYRDYRSFRTDEYFSLTYFINI
jgi:hypothetical protein